MIINQTIMATIPNSFDFFNLAGMATDISKLKPTVFIDRDGVINRNRTEHVLSWKDFQFEDGAIEGLRLLHEAGFQIVVVTNQGVIGRGLATEAQIKRLHELMIAEIELHGCQIRAVYCCPHHPDAGCFCRKPKPGMLLQAAAQFNLQLSKSWVVGDHLTDIQTGLAAGSKPVLVLTGRGQASFKKWQETKILHDSIPGLKVENNLLDAAKYIISLEQVII